MESSLKTNEQLCRIQLTITREGNWKRLLRSESFLFYYNKHHLLYTSSSIQDDTRTIFALFFDQQCIHTNVQICSKYN